LSFLFSAFTIAASLPYDIDLDNFSPEEIEQAMQMVDDVPVKRGMCRSGFIYQAITRDCIPSLGVNTVISRINSNLVNNGEMRWSFGHHWIF
jgi:hypothetical protein